jgi:hypothetical protein
MRVGEQVSHSFCLADSATILSDESRFKNESMKCLLCKLSLVGRFSMITWRRSFNERATQLNEPKSASIFRHSGRWCIF